MQAAERLHAAAELAARVAGAVDGPLFGLRVAPARILREIFKVQPQRHEQRRPACGQVFVVQLEETNRGDRPLVGIAAGLRGHRGDAVESDDACRIFVDIGNRIDQQGLFYLHVTWILAVDVARAPHREVVRLECRIAARARDSVVERVIREAVVPGVRIGTQ